LTRVYKPEDAKRVKYALTNVFIDVGRMAQSELEAGIAEWAFNSSPRLQNRSALT